jgi:tartrate-resistant acid phosphatase type 5
MTVQMTQTNADIVFYDVFGYVLHNWSMSKDLDAAA